MIENILKKNFSICWRWFYRMQIPMVIGYHDMFKDLTTFHIWGTVCMNQAFNLKNNVMKKDSNNINASNYSNFFRTVAKGDYHKFSTEVIKSENAMISCLSAMSISDMTGIPRATVVRKCKYLIESKYLKINENKQYFLTTFNIERILPHQKINLRSKAKFIRKVLNLLTIS